MDTKKELLSLAEQSGFSAAALIGTEKLCFVPEYRRFCEENRCGNYGANYACPPIASM